MEKMGFFKPGDLYGEFSNWYLCDFSYKGQDFISSEQALMWRKAKMFGDENIAEKILQTTSQGQIKKLGRQVKNYDDKKWAEARYDIMVEILHEKFSQNKELEATLLSTVGMELYEASPYDSIWGIGSASTDCINGQNLLGKALMQVRKNILLNFT